MKKCEVLVVGAGPVGTTCASRLAAMGLDVMIIEAEATSTHDLRATTIHASTLEMLDEIDAAQPLIDIGLKAPVYQMRDRRTGEKLLFDLGELADFTRFPFRLQCEQYNMARLLSERLDALPNVDLRFNCRFISAHETGEGVIATLEQGGETIEVEARFVVGADGSRSAVRKQIGTGFDGFTYEEKFVSMSTTFPINEVITDLSYVNYISDPEEWLVLLKVPSVWRVLVPADGNLSDEDLISDANRDAVFRRIVGHGNVETTHRTIYRVHQRVAQEFVKGRMIIIGDAAHLNNPLGGFGMNSGIHDGWNLADKLWQILRKDAGREALDLFERQRQAVTRSVIQAQTIENMENMGRAEGEILEAKRAKMRAVHADPDARRAFLMRQSLFASLEQEKEIT
ncbi:MULTISPECIES: FAD-dependent oxidoreductase [Novosphingobium]|mgnify:CR=1 FL=1|uniref:FAD-dependent monooxygenase n=1 Tax=Novosphingobium decolorationis TaxID=2698673 RepID=A0ABX8E9F0_9SPHN|nr:MULTISPECIES: NAD(P)/FAD-dependent oxidoreductase [Novosphingobium]QVM85649.1 FAD-dependent monooxygenase [Novosphingobium decolorationis]GAM04106.1 monooxygenase FAD-binding [Novosphingobium sp. MBES04]